MVWNWIASFFNYVERMRDRELHRDLHEKLFRLGYKYQISFYGKLVKPYDGKHFLCRMEIISKQEFHPNEVSMLYLKFSRFMPDREYAFFTYDNGQLTEVIPK